MRVPNGRASILRNALFLLQSFLVGSVPQVLSSKVSVSPALWERHMLERPCASQKGASMLLRRGGGFLRREGGFLRRGGGFLRRGVQ